MIHQTNLPTQTPGTPSKTCHAEERSDEASPHYSNNEILTCTPWHRPPGQVCMQVQVSLRSHRPPFPLRVGDFAGVLREDDNNVLIFLPEQPLGSFPEQVKIFLFIE